MQLTWFHLNGLRDAFIHCTARREGDKVGKGTIQGFVISVGSAVRERMTRERFRPAEKSTWCADANAISQGRIAEHSDSYLSLPHMSDKDLS